MMDLERSETFSDFKEIGPNHNFAVHHTVVAVSPTVRPLSTGAGVSHENENELYRTLNEEEGGILDEETINWPVLLTRVFAIFLLLLIIVFFSLEEISRKFLVLAAIFCVVLVIVIVGTFIDLRPYLFCCWRRSTTPATNIAASSTATLSTALIHEYSGGTKNPMAQGASSIPSRGNISQEKL